MPTATVTSKGQITIPKEVREAMSLKAGHRIAFQVKDNGIVEMRPETVDLLSLCGILKPAVRGVTLADMEEAIVKGASGK